MPPIKDTDTLTSTADNAAAHPASSIDDSAGRAPAPVALEVSVSVNGARTVAGSEKREPFSESTKTVLVFGNGAVIRLSSSVAPGQLLFLTNEKTKKEVVCQVVKSKNYRNVSGYVELEFTEPVVGFWGLRFPSDRVNSAATGPISAPAISDAVPQAATPKVASPVAPAPPKTVTAINAAPSKKEFAPIEPVKAEPKPGSVLNLPHAADVKPHAASTKGPSVPVSAANQVSNSTNALKVETARVQEKLSSLLFTDEQSSKTTTIPPSPHKNESINETAAKVFEIAKTAPTPAPSTAKTDSALKAGSAKLKSTLDSEQVQIPSWLEPLARTAANSAAPKDITAEETSVIEDAQAIEEHPEPAVHQTHASHAPAGPNFGTTLLREDSAKPEKISAGTNKGFLIGAIAAGLLLVAGGAWYLRGSSDGRPSTVAASSQPAIASPRPVESATQNGAAGQSTAGTNVVVPDAPVSPSHVAAQSGDFTPMAAKSIVAANNAPAPPRSTQPAEPQPKKPSLGKLHLAAPNVARTAGAKDSAEAPTLGATGVAAGADALAGGLVAGNQPAAPAAPVAVGGDVRPARTISSVPPTYPALARAQHVSGDVRIDALIEANGRVSSTKVISGPTLLHQAAIDALRQWKYQPAMLDGKPVPMHLTVTIQFRLQ
jgi:protein TonB